MQILRTILGVAGILLLPLVYWVASEVCYFRSLSPEGIVTAGDYLRRFGDPLAVHEFHRDGQARYVVTGHGPSPWSLAAPSAPPSYVFDATGKLLEWCPDRDNTTPDYNRRWPRPEGRPVDVQSFKQRYGGQRGPE